MLILGVLGFLAIIVGVRFIGIGINAILAAISGSMDK